LTRPINLKVSEQHVSWLLPDDHAGEIIASENGSMIPHRLLNPEFLPCRPRVTDIVFPEFTLAGPASLTAVSPAQCALYLMQCHVNARNLDGHGIADISAIARRCRSHRVTYGDFADLEPFFNPSSGQSA
jgi:hypothetical protein